MEGIFRISIDVNGATLSKSENLGKANKFGLMSRGVGREKGRFNKFIGGSDSIQQVADPILDIIGSIDEPCKIRIGKKNIKRGKGEKSREFLLPLSSSGKLA